MGAVPVVPVRGRAAPVAFRRPAAVGFRPSERDGLPPARYTAGGAARHVLGGGEAHDPAGVRARPRLLARDHARAALEPSRCLPGGLHRPAAAAWSLRRAHPDRPRAQERHPADVDIDGRAVRLPVQRHSVG